MTSRSIMLIIGAILLVAGVLAPVFLDSRDPEPSLECVEEGTPFSGFYDEKQDNCPVSDESYETWTEWNKEKNVFLLAGIVTAIIGAGFLVAGAIIRPRNISE